MLSSALRTPSNQAPAPCVPEARDAIGLINVPAIVIGAERDAELVPQNGPSGFCYHVLSGCVRTVCLLEDGRRQIGEFLFPGDLLDTDLVFGAETVTAVTLRRIPRAAIEARAGADPSFAARLRTHAAHQIRAARARCLLLGRKTAVERVASFLLEMAGRCPDGADGAIALPMGRTDIADYLGLTTETVCRALTEMRQGGLIRVQRTSIMIVSHAGLARAGAEWVH
jgi:CRP-like cAMP-binding protein